MIGGHAGRLPRVFTGPIGAVHLATLVVTVGAGTWFTAWTIFLTRSVGLSLSEFGMGITAAGVLGLVVGAPIGYLADRIGVRETLAVIGLIEGVALLGYLLVEEFWTFALVSCVVVTGERTRPAVRLALVAGVVDGSERIAAMSTNRVVAHVGMAVGAAVGGLILYLDTRPAYVALVLVYSAAIIGSSLLILRVPHVTSLRDRGQKRRLIVVKDWPFLAITVLFGVLALNWGMLSIGVPLWITTHTEAPIWMVAVITALNALAIVLFQNRVSRSGRTVPDAGRAVLICGVALAMSCLIFAASYRGSGVVVIVLLAFASAAHVVGELYFSTGSWGLSVGLTPREAHGEYQAMFAAGYSTAALAAPAVMTTLVAGWGVAGWLTLAGLFLLSAAPIRQISHLALRTKIRTDTYMPELSSGKPARA